MKKIKILITVFLTFTLFACDKIADVENNDPNNFSNATADLIIKTPALANALVAEGELARTANIFSNQFTGSDRQYISLNSYTITAGNFDDIWSVLYSDGVVQCRIVQKKAAEINKTQLIGLAQIIEANLIGNATALWGDVPFSQAGDIKKYPNPRYDDQINIYAGLQTLLDEAIINVDSLQGGGGYVDETLDKSVLPSIVWSKIAHSLKARFYLHTSDFVSAEKEALLGIAGAEESWIFNHEVDGHTDGKFNIMYSFIASRREGYMTAADAYLPKILDSEHSEYRGNAKTDESNRFTYLYLKGDKDSYSKIYDPNYKKDGVFWRAEGFPLITFEETKLILAESLIRQNKFTDALTALNELRNYLATKYSTNYDAYVTADFADNNALLKEILLEKYISLFGQIEVYNDLRRTDNLIQVPLKSGVTATTIPQRFVYPQSEINSNSNTPNIQDIYAPTAVNK